VGSKKRLLRQLPAGVRECEKRYAKPLKNLIKNSNNERGGLSWNIFSILIVIAFLFTLVRIEINTKKKLENDERIIKRLDMILNDFKKSRSNGGE